MGMEIFIALALVSHASFGIDSFGREVSMDEAYCQNLYWQPDAQQKMLDYGCDIDAVSAEISRVKSGRY